MKVVIVGTGYVGLVSGVCLAAAGHNVTCVDVEPSVVKRLNSGEPTIYEKGLPELLSEVRKAGRFSATTELDDALSGSDIAIVAVGTPSEGGVIDLSYIKGAARQIGKFIKRTDRYLSIVIKSTVVPGTTDTVVKGEIELASGKCFGAFGLGMNPEFLREGEAIEDFSFPDRIVLGFEDKQTLERLEDLYAPWNVDKLRVNCRTAEMIKYSNNALLATQISAVNELANFAAALGGIDIMDVMNGVHLDKRWNPIMASGRAQPAILTYLVPGCGFGGSCFPKDVQALRSKGTECGLPMHVLDAVLSVNEAQPDQVTELLQKEIGSLRYRRALVLGLAFKPGTDDVRESASLRIVKGLLAAGAHVSAHDPIAQEQFKSALGSEASFVSFIDPWESGVSEAEIIVVATRWPEYGPLTEKDLRGKTLFDARRMYDPYRTGGARYLTIGRRLAAVAASPSLRESPHC